MSLQLNADERTMLEAVAEIDVLTRSMAYIPAKDRDAFEVALDAPPPLLPRSGILRAEPRLGSLKPTIAFNSVAVMIISIFGSRFMHDLPFDPRRVLFVRMVNLQRSFAEDGR